VFRCLPAYLHGGEPEEMGTLQQVMKHSTGVNTRTQHRCQYTNTAQVSIHEHSTELFFNKSMLVQHGQ